MKLPRKLNWDPTAERFVKDDEAKILFPDGWKTVKPYLRTVAQPKK